MTLNLIETLITSIYIPKTQKTRKYMSCFQKNQKSLLQNNQRFMLIVIALFIFIFVVYFVYFIHVEGHTA